MTTSHTWPPSRGCFVTGTDTEVGKTRVSAGLLRWCTRQGWRSAALKPVAAGTEVIDGEHVNDDVRSLRNAGSLPLTDAEVGPYQFDAACAPHIAAALEGRTIDRPAILQHAKQLAARADALVVEGVGGFCVPMANDWDTADLALDLALPVVLVVGLRLGCINHALLTAEAVRARGLTLAGWVGNTVQPDMPWLAENMTMLRAQFTQRHNAPCLGLVPWMTPPNADTVADALDSAALHRVFAPLAES